MCTNLSNTQYSNERELYLGRLGKERSKITYHHIHNAVYDKRKWKAIGTNSNISKTENIETFVNTQLAVARNKRNEEAREKTIALFKNSGNWKNYAWQKQTASLQEFSIQYRRNSTKP